jgi:hypothetical protein
MKKLQTSWLAVLLVPTAALYAGVEMDLVTKDSTGAITESVKLFAQSGNIRMDDIGDASGQQMSMVFLGQEFIVIDHDNQTYVVMDEAMAAEMGSQMNAAMLQMQEQLADMPPEQRAMVEQMMQGRMAGMMMSQEQAPPPRVEKTGTGQWRSKPCTQYVVYEGGKKTQEICAAPLDDIPGADEAMRAFESMAGFINKLSESMPEPIASSMAENPMGLINQMDGFPVRTVDFVDGEVSNETTLESVVDKPLDASLFDIPEGYTRQDPFAGR